MSGKKEYHKVNVKLKLVERRKPNLLIDVLVDDLADPEFQKADRKISPFHDIIVQVINRRLQIDLTPEQLAEKAGFSLETLSEIEAGEHDVNLTTLIDIAEALNTRLSIRFIPLEDLK